MKTLPCNCNNRDGRGDHLPSCPAWWNKEIESPAWIAKDSDQLLIRSMGKSLRIIAIFTDEIAANRYMITHDAAVIACAGEFIFLANKYDQGI